MPKILARIVEFYRSGSKSQRFALAFIIVGTPILLLLAFVAATIFTYMATLPSLQDLENLHPRLATQVFDKNDQPVHEFFVEKRIWVPLDSIPKIVPEAVMAVEDQEFRSHWGMNIWAIPGAIFGKASGGKLRGASTLTQQLAKNIFLSPERSFVRKIKEMLAAIVIERYYTKDEIMELYLNQVYLGGGNYGFQAAASNYFGKNLKELTPAEAATLAGMLQRPEGLRPDKNTEQAQKRRNTVLYLMKKAQYITEEQYQSALAETLVGQLHESAGGDGSAGDYFMEEIRKYMENKYGEGSLYSNGVSVYSTLDPELQKLAEQAVMNKLDTINENSKYRFMRKFNMPKILGLSKAEIVDRWDSLYPIFEAEHFVADSAKKYPDSLKYSDIQGAAVVLDNQTGGIRAMVGGRDFALSKFNRATQAIRQPGSSFKPIVFSMAVEKGASPSDMIEDVNISIQDTIKRPGKEDSIVTWNPQNHEFTTEGTVSMRRAMYMSLNLPAIATGIKYGLPNVVEMAKRFGFTGTINAVPSLSIGTIDVTLLQMAAAYTTFPNGGNRVDPFMIRSVVGRNGEILEHNSPKSTNVLSKEVNYLVLTMLRDVTTRGTGAMVGANLTHLAGGKTGTTDDYADAWFIGFTKHYTMAVWVGKDNHKPMGHGHAGSDVAVPIFVQTMVPAHKSLKRLDYEIPEGVRSVTTCPGMQKIANPVACEGKKTSVEWFMESKVPTESCDCKEEIVPDYLQIDDEESTEEEPKEKSKSKDSDKSKKSLKNEKESGGWDLPSNLKPAEASSKLRTSSEEKKSKSEKSNKKAKKKNKEDEKNSSETKKHKKKKSQDE